MQKGTGGRKNGKGREARDGRGIREKKNRVRRKSLQNSNVRDSSSKVIFDEPILCAQFVRDFVDLPYMKDVKPENIEDVSEQFVPLFAEERNADRVKKICVPGENPFFLVSLIEHKTDIEYNVCMQVFRYMIYIWEAYEKEEEVKHEGVSKLKEFKYPPILPIVYYEGSKKWTAPLSFKCRVNQSEIFSKYIPDFEYYLVPLRDFTNEELLERADEMSLVMLFNKLQTKEDVEEFRKIEPQKLEEILKETPKHLLDVMAKVLLAFLLKENVPVKEAEELVGKVREKKVAELFANMEKMDIQEERRNTEKQRSRAELAEERANKEEQRANRAEQRANVAEQRADDAERKANVAKCQLEAEKLRAETAENAMDIGIGLYVESCLKNKMSRDEVIQKMMNSFGFGREKAEEKLQKYWKK